MKYLSIILATILSLPASADTDTVIKDFDITVSQSDCQNNAIRILQAVSREKTPVMQLEHIIFYSDSDNELVAVCRADKGLLVLFTQGPLGEKTLVMFHETFSTQTWRKN